MDSQFSHDVFISFSFKDQEIVENVVNQLLNKYHITYWICSRDIRAGEHYKRTIVKAISSSEILLLIQSQNSMASEEVPKEVSIALAKNKTVIPFVIDESELVGDLEYDLLTVQRIDATKPTWDDRIEELARQIYIVLGRPFQEWTAKGTDGGSGAAERLISSPSVIPKSIFCGREDVLNEINERFQDGERLLFVYGIGGIGKTQIAKQYAKQYKANYDTIVYATYGGDLKELFLSETPFVIEPEMIRQVLSDGTQESDEAFFERKLNIIKKCSNERTLIIIDNFDVENDESLFKLLDGKYHLLITTRCDYSRLYPTIKVGAIDSVENLVGIFMQNYQGYDVEEDDPDLIALIELVNRHTYTVELLAQHMENSGQTPKEMIEALQSEGIMSLNEEVRQAGAKTQAAYENLLKMFKVFALAEDERNVLKCLSLMPLEGVAVRDFKYWADLNTHKIIKDLENRSWITRNTGGIALHPIVRDVIRHEMPANEENCEKFLQRFVDTIDASKAWHFTMTEKEKYASIATEVLTNFPQITEKTLELYKAAESLFSFSVKPRAAVDLAICLYDYYEEKAGRISFDTGWAAFKIGWAYLFNLQLENALSNAKQWLEKAYDILSKIDLDTAYKNAVFGQLAGNLSRVNLLMNGENGNREELLYAKKYAEMAVDVNARWLIPGDPSYSKVAGGYMQLADAYVALEDYDKAMILIDKAYDILYPLFGENDSDTLHAMS